MTRNRAIKLVTAAVDRYIRTYYVFDSNLYRSGITSISGERADKKRSELEEALRILVEEPAQMKML